MLSTYLELMYNTNMQIQSLLYNNIIFRKFLNFWLDIALLPARDIQYYIYNIWIFIASMKLKPFPTRPTPTTYNISNDPSHLPLLNLSSSINQEADDPLRLITFFDF